MVIFTFDLSSMIRDPTLSHILLFGILLNSPRDALGVGWEEWDLQRKAPLLGTGGPKGD
jgi:hypothetical protein